ncbi:tripartite tricarboxylate transporter substrate binding protein [Verticiella sediminum]|uniref:Tripartite tricarboxylate transporter substrate binding protein n=1 Tax=Verticiella sediminum TaxID=1247510 RepID=A0A556B0I3_9BURK|nr:tripartite tricarboxylate transporter substrate binding protein [Verticiella sediminum]TSH98669.1 tripartite tricarboxylate transporter substrate binding protein [Verticiella sediminum]
MHRRNVVAALLALSALAAGGMPGASQAASYPERPIRLFVGFPPGGGADAVARIVANRMSEALGQSIVIENRPGAGTTLAATAVAKAPADGYTLYMGTPMLFGVDKVLYKSVTYSADDFTPITRWTTAPLILAANNDLPVKSVTELVEYAKASPGELFYASSGNGGSPHLAGLLFQRMAGVRMEHVPFNGGAPAVQAIVANDVQLTFGTPPSVIPLIEAGRLRALGVTSEGRSALFPELPTVAEQGVPDYELSFWFGLFAPAGVSKDIVDRLYAASVEALSDPEIKKSLALSGNAVDWSESPEAFGRWVVEQGRSHRQLAEGAGVAID